MLYHLVTSTPDLSDGFLNVEADIESHGSHKNIFGNQSLLLLFLLKNMTGWVL